MCFACWCQFFFCKSFYNEFPIKQILKRRRQRNLVNIWQIYRKKLIDETLIVANCRGFLCADQILMLRVISQCKYVNGWHSSIIMSLVFSLLANRFAYILMRKKRLRFIHTLTHYTATTAHHRCYSPGNDTLISLHETWRLNKKLIAEVSVSADRFIELITITSMPDIKLHI